MMILRVMYPLGNWMVAAFIELSMIMMMMKMILRVMYPLSNWMAAALLNCRQNFSQNVELPQPGSQLTVNVRNDDGDDDCFCDDKDKYLDFHGDLYDHDDAENEDSS